MAQENQPVDNDRTISGTLWQRIRSKTEEIAGSERKEGGLTRRKFLVVTVATSVAIVAVGAEWVYAQFAPRSRPNTSYRSSRQKARRREKEQNQEKPETPEEKAAREKREQEAEAERQRQETARLQEQQRQRESQESVHVPDAIEEYVNTYLDTNLPCLVTKWGRGEQRRNTFSLWPLGNRKRFEPRQVPLFIAYAVEEYLENALALESSEKGRETLRKEAQHLFKDAPGLSLVIENTLPNLQDTLPLRTPHGRVLDLITGYFTREEHENGKRVRQWILQHEQARGGNRVTEFPDDALHITHNRLLTGRGHP